MKANRLYLLILLRYIINHYPSSNSCCKSKKNNNEIHDIVPGVATKENLWCECKDAQDHLGMLCILSYQMIIDNLNKEVSRKNQVHMSEYD